MRSPPYWMNHVANTSPVSHNHKKPWKGRRHITGGSFSLWRLGITSQAAPWHVIWMIAWGAIENDSITHTAGEFTSFLSHTQEFLWLGFATEWRGVAMPLALALHTGQPGTLRYLKDEGCSISWAWEDGGTLSFLPPPHPRLYSKATMMLPSHDKVISHGFRQQPFFLISSRQYMLIHLLTFLPTDRIVIDKLRCHT